ncbi:hypothetical protein FA95DRAFT_1612350 [Auriscalpium vulgare]|uniref:Uncharacterized protein n=1 Tax=Auriscalpium vulgare TaxID=40419 RepID=A0ACB8R700_9AGAM|nr:hypothetical protein FA95DRAFT_1612350 [Auriscalpium vulgare]
MQPEHITFDDGPVELIMSQLPDVLNVSDLSSYMARNMELRDAQSVNAELLAYDYAALTVVPGTLWMMILSTPGAVKLSAGAQGLKESRQTELDCNDALAESTVRFRQNVYEEGAALTESVLMFVRRCIARPFAQHKPTIPAVMLFSDLFIPHLPVLEPFLNALPAPFKWQIAGRPDPDDPDPVSDIGPIAPPSATPRPTDSTDPAALIQFACERKDAGNTEYELREHEHAVQAYTQGIDALDLLEPQHVGAPERRLRAVLLANRAAAHLMGGDVDAVLRDGRAAEEADPTYAKGYIRQARALEFEMQGSEDDDDEWRAVLERGLRCVKGKDASAIRNMLDA